MHIYYLYKMNLESSFRKEVFENISLSHLYSHISIKYSYKIKLGFCKNRTLKALCILLTLIYILIYIYKGKLRILQKDLEST